MKFLNNLNFSMKLYLLLTIPVIGLVIYTSTTTYATYKEVKRYDHINLLSNLSIKISNVLHETQKERGLTAGYVGSNGKNFRSQLSKQRGETDKKIEELFDFIETIDKKAYGEKFQTNFQKSIQSLNQLTSHRGQVDAISGDTKNLISFYTNANNKLLDTISTIANSTKNADISNKITSYLNFLQAKEKLGIERAVGTATLAHKNFDGGMQVYFIELIAQQKAFINNFIKTTSEEIATAYENLFQEPIIKDVKYIEQSLIYTPNVKDLDTSAQKWFDSITYKINKYKEIENLQSKVILDKTEELYSKSMSSLILISAIAILMFLAIGVITRIMIKRFNKQVNNLQNGLKYFLGYIARENRESKHIEGEGSDEFAQMTQMINKQMDKIEKIIEQDKKVVKEIEIVVKKVSNGFFGNVVQEKAATEELEHLRASLNKMLDTTKTKFKTIINILNQYGKGDFNYKFSHENVKGLNGDFGAMVTSIKLLVDNISELLAVIQNAGGCLNSNTNVLSNSSTSLTEYAEAQKNALDNTTKALQNMEKTTKESISDINSSANMADTLTQSSEKGLVLASKTASSTKLINEKVEAINEAITIIDQIAFQTNILSLNAAVEAATAGEAGKGFSVVAQEVRNLATKSSEAAAEIKQLVESAKSKSLEGEKISQEMIIGYNNLKDDIQKTKTIIESIERNSKIQEKDMKKIDIVVDEMDNIVSKNVKIASDIGDLSNGISSLSSNLFNTVSMAKFRDGITQQVCDVELNRKISHLKNTHLDFKTKILTELEGIKRFDVVPPTSCQLGQWITEQEHKKMDYTLTPIWNQLVTQHKEAHKLAQEYVNKNAQEDQLDKLEEIGTSLEKATLNIFDSLDGVKRAHCSNTPKEVKTKTRPKKELETA